MLILTAMTVTVMVLAASFAVDLGGEASTLRKAHLVADLAALDGARALAAGSNVTTASETSATNNKFTPVLNSNFTVTQGYWSSGAFASGCTPSCNAVKVTATSPWNNLFRTGSESVTASAVAEELNEAQFSIGATLAEINLGLGPFGEGSLDLVGYNGLASGNVTIGALGTALGIHAVTPSAVAADNIDVGGFLTDTSTLFSATNPTVQSDLSAFGAKLDGSYDTKNQFNVGQALGIGSGNGVGLGTQVNLLQALNGGIQLANEKAGISGGLSLGVGDVTSASFSVTAIVPPTISALGPVGTTATNTQVTVTLSLTVQVPLVLKVTVPLNLTLGAATGTLSAINCGSPKSIAVTTAFNNLAISSPGATVTLLGGLGGSVPITVSLGSGGTGSASPSPATLSNPANFIQASPQVPVPVTGTYSAVTLSIGGIGLGLGSILSSAIAPAISAISSSLHSLGIDVGNADYLGVQQQCGLPSLVQ